MTDVRGVLRQFALDTIGERPRLAMDAMSAALRKQPNQISHVAIR